MKSVFLTLLLVIGCGRLKPKAPEREKNFFNVTWAKNLDTEYVTGNLPIGLGAPRIYNEIGRAHV